MNIAKITNKGGRAYNQDYLDFATENGLVCVAVADGLGAYEGSEMASEAAVNAVIKWFNKAANRKSDIFSGAAINRAFKAAHIAVHHAKSLSPEMRGSCTTLSVLITDGVQLLAAHTGDTRIYFFKNGVIEFYSKDHSMARLAVERSEITYHEIRTHKDQNKLTRVLGSEYFVQPDYKYYDGINAEDAVLICSDGFWEYVYEADMEREMCAHRTSGIILGEMESVLKKRAGEGNDNYSAALLCYGETDRGGEVKSSAFSIGEDDIARAEDDNSEMADETDLLEDFSELGMSIEDAIRIMENVKAPTGEKGE